MIWWQAGSWRDGCNVTQMADQQNTQIWQFCKFIDGLSILLTDERWPLGCNRFQNGAAERADKPGQGGVQ
jgi:hypothetical protein